LVFGGDPDASVAHGQHQAPTVLAQSDLDVTARRRVTDSR
jgi:hypothetical protein